jgi:heat shock protein HslJ
VGTSSPSNDLDVLKTASGQQQLHELAQQLQVAQTMPPLSSTTEEPAMQLYGLTMRSTNRASIGVLASDQKLTFGTAGSTAMTIDASQRVGVGAYDAYNFIGN